MPLGQAVDIGPFTFSVFRILLGFGIIRVLIKGERIKRPLNGTDKLVITLGAWIVIASFFHKFAPGSGPVYALGLAWNLLVPYFLIRIWSRSSDEIELMITTIALLLVPIAILMWIEMTYLHNLFSFLSDVPEILNIREGRVRAMGPFSHPILAGTVGATTLPLMGSIWKSRRAIAVLGISACLAMVLMSASSGPLMSLIFGMIALCLWPYRQLTRFAMPALALSYIILLFVMPAPPYFLISRIDLTGGSTGWHRAILLDGFIAHFHEWWAIGTDRTIHWVPFNPGISPDHTDNTNYYISFAIIGGLMALVLFLAILWRSFTLVGNIALATKRTSSPTKFKAWCMGSSLFAHATSGISVSYFDQSVIFFWVTISLISTFHSLTQCQTSPATAFFLKPASVPKF